MISTLQYRELDKKITEHLKRLTSLHVADIRGVHSQELVKATEESWAAILQCLLDLADSKKKSRLTPQEHAEALMLVQDVTTFAGKVETIRELRVIGEEESVGKTIMQLVDKRLDIAKENRNNAYEKFRKYMLDRLDFDSDEQ